MENVIIKIRDVSKTIKGKKIIDNVSLEVLSGQTIGIVGINGSGKSMLFKAIAGLIRIDSGTIKVFDKLIGRRGDFPDRTGFLIERPGFLPHLSGFKNLKILADIQHRISNDEIHYAMDRVGLDPLLKLSFGKYSLGMKQKLGIAQALMENPDIFILDEPMNNLDEGSVEIIRNIVRSLQEQGKTILLTSHDANDISLLCKDVYCMRSGSLSQLEKCNVCR